MKKQSGVALPIALILLLAMMMGALYLARASTSSAVMVSNLSYQRSLSRSSDQGLLRANDWLGTIHGGGAASRLQLNSSIPASGYVATFSFDDPRIGPGDAAFWVGARPEITLDDGVTKVQYIIHRLCSLNQSYNSPGNQCVQSFFPTKEGESLCTDCPKFEGMPMIHYLITSRVTNALKGTSVTNQLVVLMGA